MPATIRTRKFTHRLEKRETLAQWHISYTPHQISAYDIDAVAFIANAGNAFKSSMLPFRPRSPGSHSFGNPARRLSYLLAG